MQNNRTMFVVPEAYKTVWPEIINSMPSETKKKFVEHILNTKDDLIEFNLNACPFSVEKVIIKQYLGL